MTARYIDDLKKLVSDAGCPIFGVCSVQAIPDNMDEIQRILPGAKSIVVIGSPHSRSAILSRNIQVAQYDTILTYSEVARASHSVTIFLESMGYRAVAVPAFIPIDMSPPKYGMVGAINWKKAGVASGIGSYGESGLLVTEQYGPAIRLGGVVTDAELPYSSPLRKNICTQCMRCVEECPAGALSGGGKVDKKRCGDVIFHGGFRAWRKYLMDLMESDSEKRKDLLSSPMSLELWQNFMTGNYYYCWTCQAVCPVGRRDSSGKEDAW